MTMQQYTIKDCLNWLEPWYGMLHDGFLNSIKHYLERCEHLESELGQVTEDLQDCRKVNEQLRATCDELESELAKRNQAAECWEMMVAEQRKHGGGSWRFEGGSLNVGTTEFYKIKSPEAAVEAVCKPKPEPQLTLRTADPGRWVRARGCDVYYNSPELGVLYYWDGVYRVPNSSLDTPCHYIEDPRKQEVEG